MPNKLKVNGSWKSAGGLLVKVTTGGSSSWRVASKAFVKVSGTWYQWFTGTILDTFTRTTNSNLGTTDNGQSWEAIRGTWTADGSKAVSSSPSNYPIAAITQGTANASQSIGSVTNGTGAAFWVTDSGNWFGAVPVQEALTTYYTYSCNCSTCSYCSGGYYTYSYNCSTCSYCNSPYSYTYCGAGSSYTPSSYTPSYYGAGYSYTYGCTQSQTVCSNNGTCYAFIYGSYYIAYGCCKAYTTQYYYGSCTGYVSSYFSPASYTPGSYYCDSATGYGCSAYYDYSCNCSTGTACSSYYDYSCNCSTCTAANPTTYPAFVYILKSASNSVTRVVRTAISSVAQSISVVTSNSQNVAVKVYSDKLSTQIGADITYDAGSAQTGTKFGIILSPSDYNQGTSLDDYSSTTN